MTGRNGFLRGQVLAVKAKDYVKGARANGLSGFRIVRRDILPNVFSAILVQSTLSIAVAIIAEATRSTTPAPSSGLC